MAIEGYHVSRHKYSESQKIRIEPGRTTHFHEALVKKGNTAAEDRLKGHKPADAPCRTNCLYVFGDLGHCMIYGDSEHKGEKVHYYRVRMTKATKVPMKLVDYIRKQVDPTDAQVEQMAKEYWGPTRPWQYWEYLTEEFEVLEEVQPLDMGSWDLIIAMGGFLGDDDIAKEFCGSVMRPKAT
jgi:hypothetical protein